MGVVENISVGPPVKVSQMVIVLGASTGRSVPPRDLDGDSLVEMIIINARHYGKGMSAIIPTNHRY